MCSITGDSGSVPHILLFPFPAAGHIIPLLDLTRLLLTRGLTITVLVTPTHLPLLEPLLSTHPSTSLQTFVLSPPPVSTSSKLGFVDNINVWVELYNPILQWFQSHPSPPVAIVSDFFLGWTQNLACQLGVQRIVFSPSGAFSSSVFYGCWRDLPKRDDPVDNNILISFPKVPNSPVYPWRQISRLYRDYQEGDPDWELFKNSFLANLESWGFVYNSFHELEGVYIDHLKKVVGHDRVWTVGPLLPPEDDAVGPTARGGSSSVSSHEVITWLDGKADDSVVYVCFGSHFEPTEEQKYAIAAALECSGVHFIWCVKAAKKEHVATDSGSILDGFDERVEGRGFVIRGWAPQVPILRHRAVGAFVTHCGWNSTLEGVAAGVLMLTWPMGADQFSNAKLLVDQLGVGIRVCEGGTEIIPDSTEMARLLAESVDRTRPERTRVMQLHEAASSSVKDGNSNKNLDELVKRLSELKSEKIVISKPAGVAN